MKSISTFSYLFITLSIITFIACNPITNTELPPVLVTNEISSITKTTAVSGGIISSDGGSSITARGVCWSTKPNPTIVDNKTIDGNGKGTFSSSITGLIEGTVYFLRAYATNSAGTSYGNEFNFTTTKTIYLSPTLTTNDVSLINSYSATSGGMIISDGGLTITSRGICWNTKGNPNINDKKTSEGTGLNAFTSILNGLASGTTYYIRAYATNNIGTGYGDVISFTTQLATFNPNLTYGSVTDIDGNTYKTITIGNQTWMAENLKTSKYQNGDLVPNISDNSAWSNLITGACCNFNNDISTELKYGRLYNWYAITDNRKIAPLGWHIPSDEEWATLINYLGGTSVAGGKLKEFGTGNWGGAIESAINIATNESGFTALPNGGRNGDGTFTMSNYIGYWWSTTQFDANYAWNRNIYNSGSGIGRANIYKRVGFAVRCLKD